MTDDPARPHAEGPQGRGRMADRVWNDPRLRAVFAVAGLALAVTLAWMLRTEVMLLFASLLFGVSLFASSLWLAKRTPLSVRAAVVVWYLTGLIVTGSLGWVIAVRVGNQYGSLTERIPAALERVEERASDLPVIGSVSSDLAAFRESMFGEEEQGQGEASESEEEQTQSRMIRLTLSGLSGVLLWAVLVFYFALDGRRYVRVFCRLIPPEHREVGDDLVKALGIALPYWLIGRLASMAVVGILIGIGLAIIGIPVAFTLAVIAGLFSFVPFLGPIAAVIPAMLVTLESSPDKLLWVLAVYMGAQFLESYFITPRIQEKAVSVLPAALIAAQLIANTLLGLIGVMFATPLLLTLMIVVQVVYMKHGLGEEIHTPHAG